MKFIRGLAGRLFLLAVLALVSAATLAPAWAETITVVGNHRVDTDTIRSYFEGEDKGNTNQAVKDLYASGLFSDVRVQPGRGGLVVTVVENSVVNRVAFEGNSKIKGDQLSQEIETKSRGAYSPTVVQSDIERIKEVYRRQGRGNAKVTARTIDLPNGKLDVVFTIDEGDKTGVKAINFVGNKAYSAGRLRGLMSTTESNLLSFIKTSDVYDPDKIATDEDLIRRFYLRNGYADFRIIASDAHFDPAEGGYTITISVEEGQQYTVGSVSIDSHVPELTQAALLPVVRVAPGDIYNGDLVEKSTEALTREAGRLGYAFAQVRPIGDRNPSTHQVNLGFVIDEGSRVYIERINIRGNTRTRDYVIRREFDIGEGDPYNKVLMDRAERRLNSLGFFKKVKITTEPGSSTDRIIVDVDVEDQPTGSFSISGGYSTTDGFIAEAAVTETNFLGRGQFVKLAVQYGQHSRGIDFNFTEPYILDSRVAAGFDLFAKQSDNTAYTLYSSFVTGGTLRLGIPVTDEFSIAPHYSIYNTHISIPNTKTLPYNDCTSTGGTLLSTSPSATSIPPLSATNNCLTNGEASVAIKQAVGSTLTNLVGVNFTYSTLDNVKLPTSGLYVEIRNDFGFDSNSTVPGYSSIFLRNTGDLRYYRPIYDEIIGIVHVQGGNITSIDGGPLRITDMFQLGPSLVRGFAPAGLGPRDITDPSNAQYNPLGATSYAGASLEVQFPIFGLPHELGLKGALFADAGTVFGYGGKTNFTPGGGACVAGNVAPLYTQGTCVTVRDSDVIRSSVGASVLWASPLGPIRFDYAFALTKDKYDVTQAFRFSGGTSF